MKIPAERGGAVVRRRTGDRLELTGVNPEASGLVNAGAAIGAVPVVALQMIVEMGTGVIGMNAGLRNGVHSAVTGTSMIFGVVVLNGMAGAIGLAAGTIAVNRFEEVPAVNLEPGGIGVVAILGVATTSVGVVTMTGGTAGVAVLRIDADLAGVTIVATAPTLTGVEPTALSILGRNVPGIVRNA